MVAAVQPVSHAAKWKRENPSGDEHHGKIG